ncbi:MAG: penicillin acylase family protein, partial [Alphaproteobacteria bacterium]|nr:penicillin acylase family protein [Alphaproteobacteria bacterium]
MLRALKIAGLGIAGLLAMLVLYVGASALALRGSLPKLAGTVIVAGPSAPVRILRDADGVPHIYAKSRNDALFGLGFVHGQDRLWQMEVQRRIIQGRLSEVAGPPAVVADTYLRALGLYRAAEQAEARLSEDARAALDAYAAGVNAARPKNGKPLPPEFFMLGVDPEAWRAADSVAVLKGLAVQLSANAFQEIFRLQLLKTLGPEKAAAFSPPLPPEVVAAYRAYEPVAPTKLADALRAIDEIAPVLERTGASNNWVVGGAQTLSGKPLLANDPHLALSVPAIWYLAHLSWPGGQAIGGSIPGIPAIIAGRTDHIAWGMTTTGADTQDLYWEKLDPDDDLSYLTPTGSARFESRLETIKVRFGADKTIRIRRTRHGPVLPTDEPRLKALVPEGYVLALAWPALDPEDRTMETALGIFGATDASPSAVEKLFTPYRAPIQSFVYASDQGDIG